MMPEQATDNRGAAAALATDDGADAFMNRRPPQVSAAELRSFALTLEEHQERISLRTDGVLLSAVPEQDERAQAIAAAIAADLSDPAAAALAQLLLIDPAALQQGLTRRAAALDAFQEVWSIRTGARCGGELIDRARQLSRALVHAEIHAQAGDPQLAPDVVELHRREVRALLGRPIEAVVTRAFLAQARSALTDLAVRQKVVDALTRIPDQRTPDWAALATAGAAIPTNG